MRKQTIPPMCPGHGSYIIWLIRPTCARTREAKTVNSICSMRFLFSANFLTCALRNVYRLTKIYSHHGVQDNGVQLRPFPKYWTRLQLLHLKKTPTIQGKKIIFQKKKTKIVYIPQAKNLKSFAKPSILLQEKSFHHKKIVFFILVLFFYLLLP